MRRFIRVGRSRCGGAVVASVRRSRCGFYKVRSKENRRCDNLRFFKFRGQRLVRAPARVAQAGHLPTGRIALPSGRSEKSEGSSRPELDVGIAHPPARQVTLRTGGSLSSRTYKVRLSGRLPGSRSPRFIGNLYFRTERGAKGASPSPG